MSDQWKPVLGYESLYEISDSGQVKRVATHNGKGKVRIIGTLVAPAITPNGYVQVKLTKDRKRIGKYVHRLVLEAFVGPCAPGMQGNHINGVKVDNRLANLEYTSSSDNHFHAYRQLGKRAAKGSLQGSAKLSDADVLQIRALHTSDTFTGKQLATKFHVSESTISLIVLRRRWTHI